MRFVSAVVMVGVFAACGKAPTPKEPIKIGVMLALTGANGAAGTSQNDGVILAAEQINAAGGVLDRQIELVQKDTASDPMTAVAKAAELADAGVQIIVSPHPSSAATAIIPAVLVPNKIVSVAGSTTDISLTSIADDGYYFRTVPSAITAMDLMASRARAKGFTRFAIFHAAAAPHPNSATRLETAFTAAGGMVTYKVQMMANATSYTPELTAAYATNPEAIAVFAPTKDAAQVITDYLTSFSARGTFFFFTQGSANATFISAVGANNFAQFQHEGSVPTVNAQNPRYAAFKSAFNTRFGRDPADFGISNNYDALYVVALAIQAAGKVEGSAVRDQLGAVSKDGMAFGPAEVKAAVDAIKAGTDVNYQGVSGDVDFDSSGDCVGGYDIWKVVSGAISNLESDVKP